MANFKAIEREKARLKAKNQMDGMIGAQDIGFIIDAHNESVKQEKERRERIDTQDFIKDFISTFGIGGLSLDPALSTRWFAPITKQAKQSK